MTTRSASTTSAAGSYPACSSKPAIRSEACTFIWQPNVSTRYLSANGSPSVSGLGAFAFAFCVDFAFRPARVSKQFPGGRQHRLRRGAARQHARQFLDTPVLVQTANSGFRAAAADPL